MTQSKRVLRWHRYYHKNNAIGWRSYLGLLWNCELIIYDDTPDIIYVEGIEFEINKYFDINDIF